MLTVMFHINVKEGCEEEFNSLSRNLTRLTRDEDAGCITYRFHRQQASSRDYLLYEQWQDMDALTAHLRHLQDVLGPAREGENLPAKLLDLCESTNAIMYDVIEQ